MMLNATDWQSDVGYGVLAEALYSGAVLVIRYSIRRLGRNRPNIRAALVVLAAVLLFIFSLVINRYSGRWFPLFSGLAIAITCLLVWKELGPLWRLGIIGADDEIDKGLDCKRSLQLVTNSLDFLGIGAYKLTKEKAEFEAAIQRCSRESRPVKFLLCNPTNAELEEIARQAGKDPAEYRSRVVESLRSIAALRNLRDRNIEVRLYDRLPLFRLMFIDGWLCLASHYVFGEGDGGKWPQLLVSTQGRQVKTSLFYPFERYFNSLWQASEIWDFSSYLD
jgi:hypothetical protein